MSNVTPRRRRTDKGLRSFFIRENAYRDVWLVIVSIVALIAIIRTNHNVNQITESRRQTLQRSCNDQNWRHDSTIKALDQVLKRAMKNAPPARRQQIAASRVSTTLLIDALAPRRDCAEYVRISLSL